MNKKLLGIFLCSVLSACDAGVHTLRETEYGVRFRNLPRFLGGGVATEVMPPGQLVVVWPWDKLYTFTSTVREVSWGPNKKFKEYVNTRAKDGNEVALAVTVRYQLSLAPGDLAETVQYIATDDAGVEHLVTTVARADIRHYMNELKTAEFIDPVARARAVETVRHAMQEHLNLYKVKVLSVTLDNFRFERQLANNETDDTYQEKLDDIQRLTQETARELSRIETVAAQKEGQYNEVQAGVNRSVEEAKGYREQAKIRGDNYLLARANEAQGILSKGKAEVEGIVAQIDALAGEGGRAILKLEIAKALVANDSRFVVLNEASTANGVAVNRTDTNDLIRQLGIVDALQQREKEPKTSVPFVQPGHAGQGRAENSPKSGDSQRDLATDKKH